MAHKRLKQQSFHDSPPDQLRFSTLPVELKLKVLECFSSEELHSCFSDLPIGLKETILEYIPFEELHPGFSALPIELKHQMLEYFSFEDAARTGILSSTYNWSEHPQLILNKRLFEKRSRWIEPDAIAWMQKVTEILKHHPKGPIRKFILHIPDMQFNWEPFINNWIAFLSWKGIEVLSLDNWNITTYELSLFLFQCFELTRLKLRNCAFHKSFGSFQNLRVLHLEKITFGSNIDRVLTISAPSLVWLELVDCTGFQYLNIHAPKVGAVTISAPSLVRLELVHCTGFQYLNIHAPKLQNFVVDSSDGMSRDDVNQMSLKLGRPTLEEGDLHCRICGCRRCLGCLGWRELCCRVEYCFYPRNDTKFVFCPRVKGPEGEPP